MVSAERKKKKLKKVEALDIAIEICTNEEFKQIAFDGQHTDISPLINKQIWEGKVERKALDLLRDYSEINIQTGLVIGIVFSIALRMLSWIEYYVGTFNLSREFCIRLFEPSLFTPRGIIDCSKIAERLSQTRFSTLQDFQLASYYCIKENVEKHFCQLSEQEKAILYDAEEPNNIRQLDLVKFWSYYLNGNLETLMAKDKTLDKLNEEGWYVVHRSDFTQLNESSSDGLSSDWSSSDESGCEGLGSARSRSVKKSGAASSKIDQVPNNKSVKISVVENSSQNDISQTSLINQFILKSAVRCGAQFTISCLKAVKLMKLDAVICLVKERTNIEVNLNANGPGWVDDMVVFRQHRYNCSTDSWIPNHFFVDTFFNLLSETDNVEKFELLEKLFSSISGTRSNGNKVHTKVLENFFCWPYQDELWNLLKSSWADLPKEDYAALLLEIVDRFEPSTDDILYRENKIYNYRQLLEIILKETPSSFKTYLFLDKKYESHKNGEIFYEYVNEGKKLLHKFMNLKESISVDYTMMEILTYAPYSERYSFIKSSKGIEACQSLFQNMKYDLYQQLVYTCFQLWEEASDFKKLFCYNQSQDHCWSHIRNYRWKEADEVLNLHQLTREDLWEVKRAYIDSEEGKETCLYFYREKTSKAIEFIEWGVDTEKARKAFRYALLFDKFGMNECEHLVNTNKIVHANAFIRWCSRNTKEAEIYKRYTLSLEIAKTHILTKFNVNYALQKMAENSEASITQIVNWKPVTKLFNWCFPTEALREIKKLEYLSYARGFILIKFIELNKWDEADKFLEGLGLSPEDVIKFKKEYLSSVLIKEFFKNRMKARESNENCSESKENDATIEQFLRWYLVDNDALDTFKVFYSDSMGDSVVQRVTNELISAFNVE